MKIHSIKDKFVNPLIKSNNKLCKFAITSLIASSSMFMLSNAVDTFTSSKENQKQNIGLLDSTASVLAIVGTLTGIIGITRIENSELEESNGND